jgi:hypothetical protein
MERLSFLIFQPLITLPGILYEIYGILILEPRKKRTIFFHFWNYSLPLKLNFF